MGDWEKHPLWTAERGDLTYGDVNKGARLWWTVDGRLHFACWELPVASPATIWNDVGELRARAIAMTDPREVIHARRGGE